MEQDQQKQTLEESSRPEAIGVTRAMHQSKVRGRKRERNKHGFLAALLVLAMVALVAGAAFLLKHYVVNELLPRGALRRVLYLCAHHAEPRGRRDDQQIPLPHRAV